MRSIRTRAAFAGTFFFALVPGAQGAPQVVGDEACEKYAVDIASFATCEGGSVVKPQATNAVERRAEASSAVPARDAAPLAEARHARNATPRRQSR
jgi:hypothetical protein